MTGLAIAVLLLITAEAIPLSGRIPNSFSDSDSEFDRFLIAALERAELQAMVSRPSVAWLGSVLTGALTGFVVARELGLVLGAIVGLGAPPVVVWMRGDRTEAQLEKALPEFLEATSRNLRAGGSMVGATRGAAIGQGLLSADLERLFFTVDRGVSFGEATEAWSQRRPFQSVRAVVTTLSVGAATGVDLSGSLDQAAIALRDRAGLRAEVSALASQARASAMVIGIAPIAFLAVASAGGTPPT